MKLLATLFIFFFLSSSLAKMIIVSSTNGSDTSGCGVISLPCRTLEYANSLSGDNDLIATIGNFVVSETLVLKMNVTLKSFQESSTSTIQCGKALVAIKFVFQGYIHNFILTNCKKTAILVQTPNRNQMDVSLSKLVVHNNNQGIFVVGSGVYLHTVKILDSIIFNNNFGDDNCAGAGICLLDSVVVVNNAKIYNNTCNGNGSKKKSVHLFQN